MTAATRKTRQRILLTAERLFAEHGVDQVSARQIIQAADQGNSSAIRYHFGSKADLLAAILAHRLSKLSVHQLRMLDALTFNSDVRSLVKVLILPLAEQLGGNADERFFIHILAQLSNHPAYDKLVTNKLRDSAGMQRLSRSLCDRLEQLPEFILSQRVNLITRQAFIALADHHRSALQTNPAIRPDTALFVSNLVDSLCAILHAPMSAETEAEYARSKLRSA